MDIVLALLRTLIFVVATVAATVYVGRRIGRGHALLWTGTMLLVLHWLIGFGWTTYRAGAPDTTPDVAGWVTWAGYLLPFLAALSFVWGIGQAAGVPARGGAVGAARRTPGGAPAAAPPAPARDESPRTAGSPARPASSSGAGPVGVVPAPPAATGIGGHVASPRVTSAGPTPPGAHTPAQPRRHKSTRPPGLIVPHAVPVVMTPSASHHSPPDPDPVVDLGPDDAAPGPADPPAGTPPIAPAGWAPAGWAGAAHGQGTAVPKPSTSPGTDAASPVAPEQPMPESGSSESPAGRRPSS
jgi:hypothetical protein